MRFCWRACAAMLAFGAVQDVAAQEYPSKPIKVVVPYPAGGITDILGRIIAQGLNQSWGHPVIVENRAGAAGNIGTDHVAKAPADGYTLLVNSGPTMVISASLYAKLAYDPIRDLAPVIQAVVLPNILVVHPSVPARSVRELIALAKSKPGKLNFASAGTGTVGHMAGELFKIMAGINMVHVPYKGAAPAVTDLLGGQVDLFFDTIVSSLPHVKAGKLRLLAVSSIKGSPLLPGVPTISEAGLSGFDASPSFGVFTPAMTPRPVISRLNEEIARILNAPAIRQRLESQGAEVAAGPPADFSQYMREQAEKWGKVIREVGVKVE
ncbi:MAG: hypothetical protein A3G24_05755 [Betaproteobacteria bacterium RIFCSPLOWO2_12_FULL_62_13]|nr:MAG: hypothetical protein A3G24_05755 [Betaproteobacteria bacterium RIFCSPLOWO2_12_FULL_62_13]